MVLPCGVVLFELLHGHLAPLISDLVSKQHQREGLLHLLEFVHFVERHDDFIIGNFIDNSIHFFLIALCLAVALEQANYVTWGERLDPVVFIRLFLVGFLCVGGLASSKRLRFLGGLVSLKVQKNTTIDACGDALDEKFRDS